jgi:putative transposase
MIGTDRAQTHVGGDQDADRASSQRECPLGAPSHPRRASPPRLSDRRVHGMGDPDRRRCRPGATPGQTNVATVPDRTSPGIIACDFFTMDTVLLRRVYVPVFVEHGTRRLHMAGAAAHPTGARVAQAARNLAFDLRTELADLRFLIRDRDTKFIAAFDAVFGAEGVRIILSPPKAPRANAICERVVGTLRREVFDRLLVLDQAHLANVLDEYRLHYNRHRPHQSRAQRPPDLDADPPFLPTSPTAVSTANPSSQA